MALLIKRIQASTLVESLIAMVVVVISFGIATTVYINVLSSGEEVQKLKSMAILQKIAVEVKQDHLFLDDDLKEGEFVIEKKIVSYNGQKYLFHLKLKAFSKNSKQLAEYNELITTE